MSRWREVDTKTSSFKIKEQGAKRMKFSKTLLKTIALSLNLGFVIAAPLILFALLGRHLDKIWHTEPIFLLVGILLALLTSTFLIYRKIKDIIKE